MATIQNILAREILDSRGNPTIEVDLFSENNWARAMVPSGASTGENEALELRDNDKKRFNGKGVLTAVKNVQEKIFPLIKDHDVFDQAGLDKKMIDLDGTKNKATLGANAILAVSLANLHLAAKEKNLHIFNYLNPSANLLPTPMMNVINGGKHADSGLEIQEFMIMPVGFSNFRDALRCGVEIFHALKDVLKEKNLSTAVGDEGGFAPKLPNNEAALDIIMEAIKIAGYTENKEVMLALDAAASEFYDQNSKTYELSIGGNKIKLNSSELTDYYEKLAAKYPIISIEDSHSEKDWDGFKLMMKKLGEKLQLVGDDLFVTNSYFLQKGIAEKAANAILIKLNQIGSVSETFSTIELAKQASFRTIISHRSGETVDSSIADIAVGMMTGQIKTGSLSRAERVEKYNQLLRIEEFLGDKAHFQGKIF